METTNLIRALSLALSFMFSLQWIDGEELADSAELYTGKEFSNAFTNPEDRPGVPNVLLIGDSISIGYTVDVRKLLKDKADVFRIDTNGRYASHGLSKLDVWLGNRKWDIIHFNWGLWDLCYRNPESKVQGHRDKENGTLTSTPDDYRKTMQAIVKRLKETKAQLIWCETTPVPENEAGRFVGDDLKYNAIANSIMIENGVAINKLNAHAQLKLPEIKVAEGDVHFTKSGYGYLAEKVAQEIEAMITEISWPFNPIDHVVAFAYSSREEKSDSIVIGNRYHKGVIQKSETLSQNQMKQLMESLFVPTKGEDGHDLDCEFIPHHAFVCYSKDKQVVAYVNICLLCDKVRFWPEQADYDSRVDFQILEKLIIELNLPIYEDYRDYEKHFLRGQK